MAYDFRNCVQTQHLGEQQLGAVNSLAKSPPRLVQIGERNEKYLGELQELTIRLTSMADRVCGAVPEAVAKDGALGNSGSSVGRLEEQAEAFQNLLRKLRVTAERLDNL